LWFRGFVNMTRAIIYSLAICAAGATLEGLFTGPGVKHRLTGLQLLSYAIGTIGLDHLAR
jgi:hypothetical protein